MNPLDKLMLAITLVAGTVIVALIGVAGWENLRGAPAELGPAQSIVRQEAEMVQRTNGYREGLGLTPLSLDSKLAASAREKVTKLCTLGKLEHSPNGERFFEAIKRAGYDYALSGENLAKRFKTPENAFEGLVNSPTHLDNIVGEFKDIGVGFDSCEGENYYVIHYGRVRE